MTQKLLLGGKIFFLAAVMTAMTMPGKAQTHSPSIQHELDPVAVQQALKGFNEDSIRTSLRSKRVEDWEQDLYINHLKKEYINKKLGITRTSDGEEHNAANVNGGGTFTPQTACTNVDFETGDFTGWTGYIGDNTVSSYGPLQAIQTGFFSTTNDAAISDCNARHTIMTSAAGNDGCGGFPIVPPGYGSYVLRLGTNCANYQGEIFEQTFQVSASSTNFTYRFAVVLNDGGHLPGEQPYFMIEMRDSVGNIISPCTQYYVEAGGSIPGFQTSSACFGSSYKDWTTVGFDLLPYVNTNVTIRFTVAGCIYGGHYGYAYVDAACSNLADAVDVHFCPGNTTVMLTAPPGYGAYQWIDPSGNPIPGGTNDTIIITNPQPNSQYSVDMHQIADTSCVTTLYVNLAYTVLQTLTSNTNASCYGVADGSGTTSCANCVTPNTYAWNSAPQQNTPTALNLGAGTYIVTITDSLGCTAQDTITITQPPRQDTSNISYHFCPGDISTTLTAVPGEQNYIWISNGDTLQAGPNNQLVITGTQMGQIYHCTIWSPPACPVYDSIIITLVPPDPLFKPDSTVNVFTPNGDGINDFFYPYFDSRHQLPQTASSISDYFNDYYIATFEMTVYNRWGQKIYTTGDYAAGWDGTYNGRKAQEGVYYYVTKYKTRCEEDGAPIVNSGFVHLKW